MFAKYCKTEKFTLFSLKDISYYDFVLAWFLNHVFTTKTCYTALNVSHSSCEYLSIKKPSLLLSASLCRLYSLTPAEYFMAISGA